MRRPVNLRIAKQSVKKPVHFLLLAALLLCSVLELNSVQAAFLFLCIGGLLVSVAKQSNALIPPVAFIVVAYVFGYPIPALFPDFYAMALTRVGDKALEDGMLWALRGFGAFTLGYVLVQHVGVQTRSPRWRDDPNVRPRIRYTVYLLKSIGWASLLGWGASVIFFGISLTFIEGDPGRVDRGEGTLVQILALLWTLRFPFFLGFLVLYASKQTERHLGFLFVALLVVSIVEIVAVGSKGSILRLLLAIVLASAFTPIKLSVKQLVAGIFAVIAVYGSFAVITEYRAIMRAELKTGRSVFSLSVQVESFGAALRASLPFSESYGERRTEVGTEDIVGRFGSGIVSFSKLVNATRRQPPYEHAWESFLVPVYSIAPRALLPEKPKFFDSGRNAREYYGWTYGGVSVTLLGSLYFAWGYAGIILGMAFLGGLLAYGIRRATVPRVYSPSWLILVVIVITLMLDVGVTFHAITTNAIRVAVGLWLLQLSYPTISGLRRRRSSRMQATVQSGSPG